MQRFTLGGTRTFSGGGFGLGELRGGIFPPGVVAHVSTLFGVVDFLHSTPHAGSDWAAAFNPVLRSGPLPSTVYRVEAPIWPGPGTKTLWDYTDERGRHQVRILQPGDLDRGGNEVQLLYQGPFLLRDGSTADFAAVRMCHLDSLPALTVGQVLPPDSDVGPMGDTGFAQGDHLHIELQFLRAGEAPRFGNAALLADALDYVGIPVEDVPVLAPPTPPAVPYLTEHELYMAGYAMRPEHRGLAVTPILAEWGTPTRDANGVETHPLIIRGRTP